MPFKVRSAIGTDTGERIKIRRKSAGGYVDGLWVAGTSDDIKALASVQQPTQQQIELFTGLERDKDMKTFYVNTFVRTSSEFDDAEADQIIWKDRVYRAMHLGGWDSFGYNIVVGMRIE